VAAVVEDEVGRVAALGVSVDGGGEPGGDGFRGGGGPVGGHGVPGHGDETEFAGDAEGVWAACAEGWAEITD